MQSAEMSKIHDVNAKLIFQFLAYLDDCDAAGVLFSQIFQALGRRDV